jgi:putative ABC transport system permease protein
MTRTRAFIQRFYQLLLRCYPKSFREEYERELGADFTELWREARVHGVTTLVRLSVYVLVDTIATALREHLDMLRQDLRTARRSLLKAPTFTLGAIVTLALGIGATTAMFSVVYAVLVRPLPFDEPDRLVELVETKPLEAISAYSLSVPDFLSWKERTSSFAAMAALESRSIVITDGTEPERVTGMAASPNLWSLLGVRPLVGRTFGPNSNQADDPVALISDSLFQRRYAGDRELIGQTIHIGGAARTVIGVVPSDMGFTHDVDVWVPWFAELDKERLDDRGDRQLNAIARLKPGVTLEQASAEIKNIAAGLEREFPSTNQGYSGRARPLLERVVSPALDHALLLLLTAAGLLLVVACANVANLMLTRGLSRAPELALRRALGAGRTRLARQILTESLVLVTVAGACGVLVAAAAVRISRTALASTLPRAWDLSLDLPTLAAALVATAVTGIAFALIPAWRGSSGNTADELRAGNRASLDKAHARLRQGFVILQFCLATVLVTAAVLVAGSLQRLMDVDPGFKSERVLVTNISLPPARYLDTERRNAFYRRLSEQLSAETGVQSVGLISRIPLTPGGGPGMEISATPSVAGSLPGGRADWRVATPGFFSTLGIPLVRGRLFEMAQRLETPDGFRPLLLSESLARRLWPNGEDPINRRVFLGNGQIRTVVGIVGDVHQGSLADGTTPTMYLPTSGIGTLTMALLVRTAVEPTAVARVVREAVRGIDPEVPIFDVRTMQRQIDSTTTGSRINASLLGAFALLALVLGLVGVAGVVAHTVTLRRPELAIRMALGATAPRVVRHVATNGLKLCLYGLLAGLAGAWTMGRTLSTLLFDVRANDPTVLGGVALALFLAAALASLLPALRAARVEPAALLRGE